MNFSLPANGIELWHLAGWTMLHFLWLGTLVGMAACACRVLLRRASPNVRYVTALGCLTLLAALPIAVAMWLVSTTPHVASSTAYAPIALGSAEGFMAEGVQDTGDRFASSPSAQSVASLFATFSATESQSETLSTSQTDPRQSRGLTNPVSGHVSPSATRVATLSSTAADVLNTCVPYLPWVWLVGTPLTFALLATGIIGTRRLRHSSRPVVDGSIAELLARLVASVRVGRCVSIAVCERVAAPVLVGILRPLILLPPAALTGWSTDEIEMVLLHELAHVRRWDNAVNLGQRVIEAVLFFHPAVWLVSSWVRRERESCCDAVVVVRTNRPHAYAELLVALAAQMKPSPFGRGQGEGTSRIAPPMFSPASPMAAGTLRTRIRRILQMEDDPMLVSGKSLVLVLASLLVAATFAVLYLPAVGQAEESTATTQAANEPQDKSIVTAAAATTTAKEETPGPKEPTAEVLTTEDTEGTESSAGSTESVESDLVLSADKLQLNTPGGEVVIEAEDDELKIRQSAAKDDWLAGVAFPSPKEGEISRRAWKELGIKVVPASEAELEIARRGGFRGGLKVLGLEEQMNEKGPLIMTHIQSKRLATGVGDFAALEGALDVFSTQAPDELIVLQGIKSGGGTFQYSMRRPIDWTRGKKFPKSSNREEFTTRVYAAPFDNVPLEERSNFQRQIMQFDPARNASFRWAGNNLTVWGPPEMHSHLAEMFEQGNPFPSLADQKLADAVFRRLGWELEPIGAEDVARVKTLGYDGGVRVAYAPQPGGFSNISYGSIQTGDILVGLHVWPTASLAQVLEVLTRDDLAELNPIKFYVVRQGQILSPTELPKKQDTIQTGRITVQVDRKTPQPQIGTTSAPLPLLGNQGLTPARPAPSSAAPTGSAAIPHSSAAPATGGFLLSPSSAGPDTASTPVGLSILFFHSPDSAPSRTMRLLMKRIAEVPPQANFIEVDVTKSPELARQMNVNLVPTCFVVRDGKELARITGELPESQLRAQMSAVMRSGNPRTANSPTTGAVSPFVSPAEPTVQPTVPVADPIAPTLRLTDQPAVSVVPEAKTALIAPTSPPQTAADPNDKANLRYDGKTFDEWRTAWRTELSTEKRLEAIQALAAFGGSGYGPEAAETVLEIAQQYDWRLVYGQSANPLQDAIVDALFGNDVVRGIPAENWFPRTMEGVRAGDKRSQQLMQWILINFHRLGDDADFAIDPLLELTRSDDEALRIGATRALAGLDLEHKNPPIVARLKEMLESGDSQQIIAALENVRLSSNALPFDLSHLLFHSERQVRIHAQSAIHNLRPKQDKDLGQWLMEVVNDPQRADDHIHAIRALGSLHQRATPAYATLEKRMLDREQPIAVRIAAMKALERITRDGSIENRLRAAFIEENKQRQDSPEFKAEFQQLEQLIQAESAAIP